MHDVFISYSSKDSTVANAVCHILEDSNIRCFIAHRDIAPGAMWAESLVSAIKQSKVFVLVFSEHSNQSKQVYKEITIAVEAGLTVIPFITSADKPQGVLEYYIADTHWIDALTPPLENHIHRLADRVSYLLKETPDVEIKEAAKEAVKEEGLNDAGNMPAGKDGIPHQQDQSIQASSEYCRQCGFRHDLHHCPVCGSVRTDVYHQIKRGKVWTLLSSFTWLILIAYSVFISGSSLNQLGEDYEFSWGEYVALSLAFVSIIIFCVLLFELVSRAAIRKKRIKKGEEEIAARLKCKSVPLYQRAFFTGMTFIILQLAMVIGYFLTT